MIKDQNTPEERMLRLFARLRNLDLDHCPDFAEGVSPAQMTLLAQIVQDPGCGVQDIAGELNLSAPTVSVGVAKLEERGLVKRKPDPDDRRSVQFFISNSGQELHNKFNQARLKKFHRLLSGLSKQDQTSLLNLLERALKSVERESDPVCEETISLMNKIDD